MMQDDQQQPEIDDDDAVFFDGALRECRKTRERILFGRRVIYNDMSALWFYVILFLAIGFVFALTQEMFVSHWDELYPVDFWSVAHFSSGVVFFILFFIFTEDKLKAFLFTFIFLTTFEVVEWLLSLTNFAQNILVEIIWNRLADIIFNTIGIIVGYYICIEYSCKVKDDEEKRKDY